MQSFNFFLWQKSILNGDMQLLCLELSQNGKNALWDDILLSPTSLSIQLNDMYGKHFLIIKIWTYLGMAKD